MQWSPITLGYRKEMHCPEGKTLWNPNYHLLMPFKTCIYYSLCSHHHNKTLMPNTNRQRRHDCRRCVLNSQLAHDNCQRKFGNWTCREFIPLSWVELSCVSGVYAPVRCRDPVYNSAAYMRLSQKIGNWVTTDDWCVHTADTTQLDFVVGKLFRLVETRRDCRQLVANLIHTDDATQLDSWVASASAVCIGL